MDPTRKIIRKLLNEGKGVFQKIGDGSISAPPPGYSDRMYPRDLFQRLLAEQKEHVGEWYHGGGPGVVSSGEQLYVTDELSDAQYYADMNNDGIVYRLKDAFHPLVNWATGQSEGVIEQKAVELNGGWNALFEPLESVAGRGEPNDGQAQSRRSDRRGNAEQP